MFGNCAALFDCEVSDAAIGIELIGSDQRVSGSGIDAAGAASAAVGRGHIGLKLE